MKKFKNKQIYALFRDIDSILQVRKLSLIPQLKIIQLVTGLAQISLIAPVPPKRDYQPLSWLNLSLPPQAPPPAPTTVLGACVSSQPIFRKVKLMPLSSNKFLVTSLIKFLLLSFCEI